MERRGNGRALGQVFIGPGCHGRALERGDSDGFHRGDHGKNQGALSTVLGLISARFGTDAYGGQGGVVVDGQSGVGLSNSKRRRGGRRRDLAMQGEATGAGGSV